MGRVHFGGRNRAVPRTACAISRARGFATAPVRFLPGALRRAARTCRRHRSYGIAARHSALHHTAEPGWRAGSDAGMRERRGRSTDCAAELGRSVAGVRAGRGNAPGVSGLPRTVPNLRYALYADLLQVMARVGHLLLSNVFVPYGGVRANVICEERRTFGGIQINHIDAERTQPVRASLKVAAFADNDGAETKLAYQPAAIPAGRERRNYNKVAITALAAGVAECVRLAVHRGIALLHAAVAPGADELPGGGIEDGRADGDATFGKAGARFLQGDGEHGGGIEGCHGRLILAGGVLVKRGI